MKIRTLITLMLVSSGCAHHQMRGSVVMKINGDEAHVCLGDFEVFAGDRVVLYKNVCSKGGKDRNASVSCEKIKLGNGRVERVLNEHYSLIKVDDGVEFEEGDIVEKSK